MKFHDKNEDDYDKKKKTSIWSYNSKYLKEEILLGN